MATVSLMACAGNAHQAASKELRFDTETAARIRHAAAVGRQGARVLSPAATHASSSTLAGLVPFLVTLLGNDNAVDELEEQLVECAHHAERLVNLEFFGHRAPTRQECGEEVEVDGCGERITRAMLLGQRKHVLALRCAKQVLEQRYPAPFSIEQRYRFYPHARLLETISKEEEARLISQGCTRELWRTIKPDLVLHSDSNLLRSVLTLDFKFPCPDTNEARWTRYGEKSAYADSNQGHIYREALQGKVAMISPRRVVW
ncbi:hypothetical protein ACN469_15430 [Corallococcus terminator]